MDNRSRTVWQKYGLYIIGGIALFAVILIVGFGRVNQATEEQKQSVERTVFATLDSTNNTFSIVGLQVEGNPDSLDPDEIVLQMVMDSTTIYDMYFDSLHPDVIYMLEFGTKVASLERRIRDRFSMIRVIPPNSRDTTTMLIDSDILYRVQLAQEEARKTETLVYPIIVNELIQYVRFDGDPHKGGKWFNDVNSYNMKTLKSMGYEVEELLPGDTLFHRPYLEKELYSEYEKSVLWLKKSDSDNKVKILLDQEWLKHIIDNQRKRRLRD